MQNPIIEMALFAIIWNWFSIVFQEQLLTAEVFNLWFVEISETISEATMIKENMFIHCI